MDCVHRRRYWSCRARRTSSVRLGNSTAMPPAQSRFGVRTEPPSRRAPAPSGPVLLSEAAFEEYDAFVAVGGGEFADGLEAESLMKAE